MELVRVHKVKHEIGKREKHVRDGALNCRAEHVACILDIYSVEARVRGVLDNIGKVVQLLGAKNSP